MQQNKKPNPSKTYQNRHLVIPIFFNEPPDLTGWTEGVPGIGRVVAVKSVLYSDGSAKRWYRMAAKRLNRKGRRKKQ